MEGCRKLTCWLLARRHHGCLGSSWWLGTCIVVSWNVRKVLSIACDGMVMHISWNMLEVALGLWARATIRGVTYWNWRRIYHLSWYRGLGWLIVTAWYSPSLLSNWSNRHNWVKYSSLYVRRTMKSWLRQFDLYLWLSSDGRLQHGTWSLCSCETLSRFSRWVTQHSSASLKWPLLNSSFTFNGPLAKAYEFTVSWKRLEGLFQ